MLDRTQTLEVLSDTLGRLSSKRVFANRICWALIVAFLALTAAICYRIAHYESAADLGMWVVVAYAVVTIPLTVLGGVIYRKPDGGSDAPPK